MYLTWNRRRRVTLWVLGALVALIALPLLVQAQVGQPSKMTRATSTTGLNDSTLIAVSDSARRTRAASAAQLRKTLSVKGFDSLIVAANGRLRFAGTDTVVGTPSWLNAQTFAAGIVGTATNDNATAGNVGEFLSHATSSGSAVTLSTGTTANIDSLTLTAGDWDVFGVVDFNFAGTTSYTNLAGGVSTTTATLGTDQGFDFETPAAVPTATKDMSWPVSPVRFSVAGSTKVYLVAQGTFTVAALKAYGTIRARRVR